MSPFKEYIEDLQIEDLTTKEQSKLRISIHHIVAQNNIDFGEHKHRYMNQTISVLKGELKDIRIESDIITYKEGDCLFIPKNNNHRFRYCKDSELMVVYIPGLKSKNLKTSV